MNEMLANYLAARDYGKITEAAVAFVRDWFAENGKDAKAVIGISGGKDSSVVAALCVRALGKERVVGVLMPRGEQADIDVSRRLVHFLGIQSHEINVGGGYDGIMDAIRAQGIVPGRQAEINLGPRVRMATLYAVAQCVNGRVSNNGNASERYVGYFTKYGDGAGDFAPLANLTVSEVRLVGSCLGLPDEFTLKPPADGLTGLTDEDNLGFSYETLDSYILTGVCEDPAAKEAIDRRHAANAFKLRPIPTFEFK